MPRLRDVQSNFVAGELDPLLIGRTDLKHYFQGCELARNVFLLPQGGARRRPGLEFIDVLPETITRVTGQTITAPNGGTTANANDDDITTLFTTTTGISTTDPYVVAHYDLLAAKTIKFADILGFSLDAGTSAAEFRVQYSTDDAAWNDFGTDTMDASTTAINKRFHSTTAVSARYWRFVRIGATDLTTSIATILEFNVWEESGTLSASRCVDFEFSTTQTYKMIFSDFNIAVYVGKTLQTHIKTPYSAAALSNMTWTQSLDTMILFQEDIPVQKLVRGSANDLWTLSALAFDAIPSYRFTPADSNPAATLTPSAITGTVDLTASAGVFTSADVGQYISGNGGYARIVSFTSTTVVKAYVITPFWDTTVIASGDWILEAGYEAAWSTTRGYPRTGTFHQSRLVVAGSRDLPQSIWFSKINLFFDFDLGTNLDDEGIALTLDTDEVSAINAIFSGRHLQIYTSNAEFFVPTYSSGGSVITPNNIEVRRATRNGSVEGLRVHNVDGATMYLNRSGGALREFLYIDTEQSYASSNISLLSSHLVRTPVDTAFRKATSTEDADYMLLVNSDGTLAMLNTLRDQELNGWSLQETDGLFKSCGVELDTMFFVVERTINGTTSRFVEYFDDKHSLDNSFYTDAGLPNDTFTGLERFNGATVEVVADGARLANVTVSGGTAVIERDAETEVEIGLNYVQTGDSSGDGYKIKTMPIEGQLPDGTLIGRKKRTVEVTAQVSDTQSIKLNGNLVGFRQIGGSVLDVAPIPFTGYKVAEGLLGFADQCFAECGDDVPLPATINSLAYKVAV